MDGIETIQDTITKLPQGWRREVTVRWQGIPLRVTLTRDSYIVQSHAKVEAFSRESLKWNVLRSMTAEEAGLDSTSATATGMVNAKAQTENAVEKLVAYAQELIPATSLMSHGASW